MNSCKKILLMIPAYNEEENIGTVLDQLKQIDEYDLFDILVINDGSSDQTVEKAKAHGAEVLSQCFNMGYGAALQTGYKYAVGKNYEYVLQMDADGQHDVINLSRILKAMDLDGSRRSAGERIPDIVIGSRFLDPDSPFKASGLKKIAIGFFNWVIRRVTGYRLTDPTSGLQGLNRKAYGFYAGYGNFDIKYPDLNMILQMLLLGYHIEEVPAMMHPRMAGTSMHQGMWKAGWYMIIMSLSTLNTIVKYGRRVDKLHEAQ